MLHSGFLFRKARFAVTAFGLAVAALSHAQSNTNSPIERVTDWYVNTNGTAFAGAELFGTLNQLWAGVAGSYSYQSFSLAPGLTFDGWTGDYNVSVTGVSESNNVVTGEITNVTGNNGWTQISENGPVNAASTLTTVIDNGHVDLQLNSNSEGGTAAGDPFYWNAYFTGDWSSQGTGVGQSELLSYNSADGWTLTEDFVYIPQYNVTWLQLYLPSQNYDGVGAQVQLNGAATPGPAAVAPFALGLLGLVRRKRK
jgi:MYXO-CTERM domain-containing protein